MLRFGDSRKRYQYAKKHEMNISKAGGVINRDGRRWNVYRKPNNTHYRLIVNKNGTVRAEQVFKMLRQPGFQTKNEKNANNAARRLQAADYAAWAAKEKRDVEKIMAERQRQRQAQKRRMNEERPAPRTQRSNNQTYRMPNNHGPTYYASEVVPGNMGGGWSRRTQKSSSGNYTAPPAWAA